MAETGSSLLKKYSGPLRVFIETPSGEIWEDFKNFKEGSTLFDYVGQAAACIFTNLTTWLCIRTSPEDWEIKEFSPAEGILWVKQVGGEPLEYEEDDAEKLYREHGFTPGEAEEFLKKVLDSDETDLISLN